MSSSILPSVDENLLWTRLCKGDRKAFAAIYTIYFPILFEYCIRFTPDRNLIKDILQDFFIGLLKDDNEKLSAVQHLKSYLLVSVRRKLIRHLDKTPDKLVSEEQVEFCLELSPEISLINKQQDADRSRRLQETINGLTTRQREAIYLHFYENTPYDEIAVIMGLKEVKYARTLVYRALTEIRLVLQANGESFLKKLHFS